jgi:hypothetical protein
MGGTNKGGTVAGCDRSMASTTQFHPGVVIAPQPTAQLFPENFSFPLMESSA